MKFISFLGAIPYGETRYYFDTPDRSLPATHYVQEAIVRAGLPPWQPEDRSYIFTTPEARQANYHQRVQRGGPPLPGEGLEHHLRTLREMGKLGHFEAIDIPNGYTEAEIWKVFDQIFQRLEPGDEVYFDITYGFRSLPMLGMVLLNYAKALREIEVRAIYYGNYEAGRAQRQQEIQQAQAEGADEAALQALRERPIVAPILNLTAFSQLQDWTYGAQSFLYAGNAEPLARLVKPTRPDIGQQLLAFTQAIHTCRGLSLTQDLDIETIKQIVAIEEPGPLAPLLRPLLDQVKKRLDPFQKNSILNGLLAVDWCIRHDLIQQGYTLLQESFISLLVSMAGGDPSVYPQRHWANAALNGYQGLNSSPYPHRPEEEQLFEAMIELARARRPLIQAYQRMTGKEGLRNDINHGGSTRPYASPDHLRQELSDIYQTLMQQLAA